MGPARAAATRASRCSTAHHVLLVGHLRAHVDARQPAAVAGVAVVPAHNILGPPRLLRCRPARARSRQHARHAPAEPHARACPPTCIVCWNCTMYSYASACALTRVSVPSTGSANASMTMNSSPRILPCAPGACGPRLARRQVRDAAAVRRSAAHAHLHDSHDLYVAAALGVHRHLEQGQRRYSHAAGGRGRAGVGARRQLIVAAGAPPDTARGPPPRPHRLK